MKVQDFERVDDKTKFLAAAMGTCVKTSDSRAPDCYISTYGGSNIRSGTRLPEDFVVRNQPIKTFPNRLG